MATKAQKSEAKTMINFEIGYLSSGDAWANDTNYIIGLMKGCLVSGTITAEEYNGFLKELYPFKTL
jgi:hypothetical protein